MNVESERQLELVLVRMGSRLSCQPPSQAHSSPISSLRKPSLPYQEELGELGGTLQEHQRESSRWAGFSLEPPQQFHSIPGLNHCSAPTSLLGQVCAQGPQGPVLYWLWKHITGTGSQWLQETGLSTSPRLSGGAHGHLFLVAKRVSLHYGNFPSSRADWELPVLCLNAPQTHGPGEGVLEPEAATGQEPPSEGQDAGLRPSLLALPGPGLAGGPSSCCCGCAYF